MELDRKYLIRRAVLCFILLGFFLWLLWQCVVTGDPCGLLLFSILGSGLSLLGVLWNAPFSRPVLRHWHARWDRANLLATDTAKLAEIGLFPDEESRLNAIRYAQQKLGNNALFAGLGITFAGILGVGSALLASKTIPTPFSPQASGLVFLPVAVAGGICARYLVRAIFARGQQRLLRERLVSIGVPVCLRCGYDLRALTEARCPECGAAFDPKLLDGNTADNVR